MPVIWWDKKMVKALLLPGGICVSVTVLVLNFGLITLAPSAIHFYYYAVFVSGVLVGIASTHLYAVKASVPPAPASECGPTSAVS